MKQNLVTCVLIALIGMRNTGTLADQPTTRPSANSPPPIEVVAFVPTTVFEKKADPYVVLEIANNLDETLVISNRLKSKVREKGVADSEAVAEGLEISGVKAKEVFMVGELIPMREESAASAGSRCSPPHAPLNIKSGERVLVKLKLDLWLISPGHYTWRVVFRKGFAPDAAVLGISQTMDVEIR